MVKNGLEYLVEWKGCPSS